MDQDYEEALKWYQKAVENGARNSANNLGLMYLNGDGVPKDRKMAEMFLKEAVILRDFNAPVTLGTYYLEQMEPELALGTFRTAKQMGNTFI